MPLNKSIQWKSSYYFTTRSWCILSIVVASTTICYLIFLNLALQRRLYSSKQSIFRSHKFVAKDRSRLKHKEDNVGSKQFLYNIETIKRSTENIFFIESSCATGNLSKQFQNRSFILSARQYCAVEATAMANPRSNIYLLLTCPVQEHDVLDEPAYVTGIFDLANVHVVVLNVAETFRGSPVERLYNRRFLEHSRYPVEHSSDVLRMLVLWKYGGTYCDLDVITLRPFKELGTNFIGIEEGSNLNNAILNVEPFGFGHDLIEKALQYVNENFDGTLWKRNGAEVLEKVILEECGTHQVIEAAKVCKRFSIYASFLFYPIPYGDYMVLFQADADALREIASTSYVVHTWNRLSRKEVVRVGSQQLYGLLADEYCTSVYRNSGEWF